MSQFPAHWIRALLIGVVFATGCGSAVESGEHSVVDEAYRVPAAGETPTVLGQFQFTFDGQVESFAVAEAAAGNALTNGFLSGDPAGYAALTTLTTDVNLGTLASNTIYYNAMNVLSSSGITISPKAKSQYWEDTCLAVVVSYPSDLVYTSAKTLTNYSNRRGLCAGTVWSTSSPVTSNIPVEISNPGGTNFSFLVAVVGNPATDPGAGGRFAVTDWNYLGGVKFRKSETVWPAVSITKAHVAKGIDTGIPNTVGLPSGLESTSTWRLFGEFDKAAGKTLTATLDGEAIDVQYISATEIQVDAVNTDQGPNGYFDRELKFFINDVAESDTLWLNGRNEYNVRFQNSGLTGLCGYYVLGYLPGDGVDSGNGFWCPKAGATPVISGGWNADCGGSAQVTHGMLGDAADVFGLYCATKTGVISQADGARCILPTIVPYSGINDILTGSQNYYDERILATDWADYNDAKCATVNVLGIKLKDPDG